MTAAPPACGWAGATSSALGSARAARADKKAGAPKQNTAACFSPSLRVTTASPMSPGLLLARMVNLLAGRKGKRRTSAPDPSILRAHMNTQFRESETLCFVRRYVEFFEDKLHATLAPHNTH